MRRKKSRHKSVPGGRSGAGMGRGAGMDAKSSIRTASEQARHGLAADWCSKGERENAGREERRRLTEAGQEDGTRRQMGAWIGQGRDLRFRAASRAKARRRNGDDGSTHGGGAAYDRRPCAPSRAPFPPKRRFPTACIRPVEKNRAAARSVRAISGLRFPARPSEVLNTAPKAV